MRDRRFFVYQLTFPDGGVYIGRTGMTIEERMAYHLKAARGTKEGGIRLAAALLRWPETQPSVLWEGTNFYQSMGREIAAIRAAKRRLGVMRLLNRTRGGFYDLYDARLKRPKKRATPQPGS